MEEANVDDPIAIKVSLASTRNMYKQAHGRPILLRLLLFDLNSPSIEVQDVTFFPV